MRLILAASIALIVVAQGLADDPPAVSDKARKVHDSGLLWDVGTMTCRGG